MMYYDRSYKKVSKIIFHSMRRCLRYDPVFLRVWFGFLLRRVLLTPQDKLLPWTHPYNFEGGVVYTLINYLLQPCGKCRLSLLIHLSLERSIEILSRIKAKKTNRGIDICVKREQRFNLCSGADPQSMASFVHRVHSLHGRSCDEKDICSIEIPKAHWDIPYNIFL